MVEITSEKLDKLINFFSMKNKELKTGSEEYIKNMIFIEFAIMIKGIIGSIEIMEKENDTDK